MIETMTYIRVVNFEELQHYKSKPTYPWIKLHCKLLTNRAFMSLPAESFRLGIIFWILASETGNEIPYHPDDLAWRLHCKSSDIEGWVKPLQDKNFIELYSGPRVTIEEVYSNPIIEEKREEESRVENITDDIDIEKVLPVVKDKENYSDDFLLVWSLYPSRGDESNPKKPAWKAWRARLREGIPTADLIQAVKGYNQDCVQREKVGTEYVLQAQTFFGPNERWKEFFNKREKEIKKQEQITEDNKPIPELTDEEWQEQKRIIHATKVELEERSHGRTDHDSGDEG